MSIGRLNSVRRADGFESSAHRIHSHSHHHHPHPGPTPNPGPTPSPTPGPTPNPNPGPTPSPTPNPGPSGRTPGPRNVTLPNVSVPKGQTEIEAVLTIDKYQGLIHGRNGTHEIAYGHITLINAVGNKQVVGTQEVELAMNVKSSKDPNGLPQELPLQTGQQIEVEGVYIPASQAGNSGDAVIHFTHSPDGYVIMPDGSQYQ
jgi:hypothetical protein